MGKTGIQSTFYLDKDAKTCLVEDAKKEADDILANNPKGFLEKDLWV